MLAWTDRIVQSNQLDLLRPVNLGFVAMACAMAPLSRPNLILALTLACLIAGALHQQRDRLTHPALHPLCCSGLILGLIWVQPLVITLGLTGLWLTLNPTTPSRQSMVLFVLSICLSPLINHPVTWFLMLGLNLTAALYGGWQGRRNAKQRGGVASNSNHSILLIGSIVLSYTLYLQTHQWIGGLLACWVTFVCGAGLMQSLGAPYTQGLSMPSRQIAGLAGLAVALHWFAIPLTQPGWVIGWLAMDTVFWHVLGASTLLGFFFISLLAPAEGPSNQDRVMRHTGRWAQYLMLVSLAGTALVFKTPAMFAHALTVVATIQLLWTIYHNQYDAVKLIFKPILWFLFRVSVTGTPSESSQLTGRLIIANHTSYLDVPLIAALWPTPCIFAINTQVSKVWWIRLTTQLAPTFPIDPQNPHHLRGLIKEIQNGKTCVIFPEGRMTTNGSLGKIFPGFAMLAQKTGVPITPIYIEGTQWSYLSKIRAHCRKKVFPKLSLHIGHDIDPQHHQSLDRNTFVTLIYDTLLALQTSVRIEAHQHLSLSLIQAAAHFGFGHIIAEDHQYRPLTYGALLTKINALALALGRAICKDGPIGVMLPTSNAAVVSIFSLYQIGATPALLNTTSGVETLIYCCQLAGIQTILTSRAFIEATQNQALVEAIADEKITWLYLEDLANALNLPTKLTARLTRPIMGRALKRHHDLSKPPLAALLFTSGSEGRPKCVALSHQNILANVIQIRSVLDFTSRDILCNAMPLFHSFGFTVGTMTPLLLGTKVALYPNPLHFNAIAQYIYDNDCTILMGTNTFLNGYQRAAQPVDFQSLRYVFCGAEKLSQTVATAYMERFGLRILEGYGATETAPVIAFNTPMHHQSGSVGRLLPLIDARLTRFQGAPDGGILHIKGPNVMTGYYQHHPDQPNIMPPDAGWYDTGDVVTLDDNRMICIIGRCKRFAKIGGEMVSLTAVEGLCQQGYPDAEHAILQVPDAKKGEALVWVTTDASSTLKALKEYYQQRNIPMLSLPKHHLIESTLPKMPTGKLDYPALAQHIQEKIALNRE